MDPQQNPQQQYPPVPPQQQAPLPLVTPPAKATGSQKIILIIIATLVVIALIGGAYALGKNKKDSNSNNAVTSIFDDQQPRARDTERETDIKALHGQIEAYWAQYGYYPTLANLNDNSFVATYLRGLDQEALRDPQGSGYTLVSTPTKGSYSYEVSPKNCDNIKDFCNSYVLTATTEEELNGVKQFVKKSLND